MSFNKNLWFGAFDEGHLPAFPCPTCKTGSMREAEGTFSRLNATYANNQPLDDLPEDYIQKQFSMLARCSNHDCGEVVAIAGTYTMEETEYDGRWALGEALNIKGMFPAPKMIDLSEEAPRAVRYHLEKSFRLYWVDYGACLNAVRSAGEQILNELKVPKTKRMKAQPATAQQPAKPARTIQMDFNGRIQWLSKKNRKRAKIVDALRKLGNLGSHGHSVNQSEVHSAMRLLDYLITELFEKHIILKLADEIIAMPKPHKKK